MQSYEVWARKLLQRHGYTMKDDTFYPLSDYPEESLEWIAQLDEMPFVFFVIGVDEQFIVVSKRAAKKIVLQLNASELFSEEQS